MRRILKKDRNGLKLILAILLLLIICIFIAYFFWTWAELSDNGIAFEEITSYAYSSLDGEYKLRFVSEKTIYISAESRHVYSADNLEYIDGIIKLENDEGRILFAILSDGRVYSRADNVMLYRIERGQNEIHRTTSD